MSAMIDSLLIVVMFVVVIVKKMITCCMFKKILLICNCIICATDDKCVQYTPEPTGGYVCMGQYCKEIVTDNICVHFVERRIMFVREINNLYTGAMKLFTVPAACMLLLMEVFMLYCVYLTIMKFNLATWCSLSWIGLYAVYGYFKRPDRDNFRNDLYFVSLLCLSIPSII